MPGNNQIQGSVVAQVFAEVAGGAAGWNVVYQLWAESEGFQGLSQAEQQASIAFFTGLGGASACVLLGALLLAREKLANREGLTSQDMKDLGYLFAAAFVVDTLWQPIANGVNAIGGDNLAIKLFLAFALYAVIDTLAFHASSLPSNWVAPWISFMVATGAFGFYVGGLFMDVPGNLAANAGIAALSAGLGSLLGAALAKVVSNEVKLCAGNGEERMGLLPVNHQDATFLGLPVPPALRSCCSPQPEG
jgi:hypothetical protein